MPQDNDAPVGPYVQFAEGMSEEEVRETMASLVALSGCFNTLMGKLEETAAAPSPPDETAWHQEATEFEALRLVIEFLRTCDPPSEKVITSLFNRLLAKLSDELARKRSTGPDGVKQNPAEYVLTGSIWKADCAASVDVLICSRMTRRYVETEWLGPALVRHGLSGHTTAKRAIDWRDETVSRLHAHRRDKAGHKKPLDVMAEIFDQRRPTGPDGKRERMSQAKAERRADEWLRDTRLNIPKTPT